MAQTTTLAEAEDRYWQAFRAKERAFYTSESLYRDWMNAHDQYESARRALAEAGAALEEAARNPA